MKRLGHGDRCDRGHDRTVEFEPEQFGVGGSERVLGSSAAADGSLPENASDSAS
ncbi:MAG: hypothetical protein R2697_06845 [Ilumatobacteraceae bacterium]